MTNYKKNIKVSTILNHTWFQLFNFPFFQLSNLLISSFLILNFSFLICISQNSLDQLQYNYYSNTNRLEYLIDAVGSATSTVDIDNQSSTNYAYDAVGQLTQDISEGILDIDWTVSGKVKKVSIDDDGNAVADRTLEFKYDALGNRVKKIETTISTAAIQTTIYIRNATGDLISIYESDGTTTERIETNISGVGIDKADEVSASSEIKTRSLGNKNYELKDHLGNVRVVVNDVKEPSVTSGYMASIQNAIDYYSYGMQMSDRSLSASEVYRFGFNGKEKDDELKGNGNSYDFDARIYDPRLGLWLSRDPKEGKYPSISPYSAMGNNPVYYVDENGEEPVTKELRPHVFVITESTHANDMVALQAWITSNPVAFKEMCKLAEQKRVDVYINVGYDYASDQDPDHKSPAWVTPHANAQGNLDRVDIVWDWGVGIEYVEEINGVRYGTGEGLNPGDIMDHEFDHALSALEDYDALVVRMNTNDASFGDLEERRVITKLNEGRKDHSSGMIITNLYEASENIEKLINDPISSYKSAKQDKTRYENIQRYQALGMPLPTE